MRYFATLLFLFIWPGLLCSQEAARPITAEEALRRVDQRVTVLMEVKSTGGNTARFLNSETDFRSEKNFAVFIPNLALASYKKAGIEDPGQFYKGKTITVTGQVVLSQERPVIRAENPDQIKVVSTASPRPAASKPVKPR
jgi:hypothetical protein